MAASNAVKPTPARAGCATCAACGNPVPPGREARHPLGADGDVFCLECEHRNLVIDYEVAIATLDLLEATIKAALNGQVSPEDVAALVARATSEMDTVPQLPVAELSHDLRLNRERRGE